MGLCEEALRSDIPVILIDVKGDLPNLLLASPSFASWRQGASLDIREWLTRKDGRTPAVIVSVVLPSADGPRGAARCDRSSPNGGSSALWL